MKMQNSTQHYRLELLGEGVYAAIAKDGGAAICNAGIVDLGGATLVVDAFLTPSAAEDLRADAHRLTGRSPRWVVNTHYHHDHIWGNQVFLPETALISTVATRDLIQTAGKGDFDHFHSITDDRLKDLQTEQAAATTEAERAASDLWVGFYAGLAHDFPRLKVTLPDLVFKERLTLFGSRRRADLIEFVGAHTGSDVVVYLPDDGVIFMSDLLMVGFHPYLADGNPGGMLEALLAILRLSCRDGLAGIQNATHFIPGHGPLGTFADVQKLADYIQDCQQIARELVERGTTGPAEVEATPIPEAYQGLAVPSFFYENLKYLVDKNR
jgi:glyoxylase-like metal-dependent hydrolase (beta-lactamase superfamily II)